MRQPIKVTKAEMFLGGDMKVLLPPMSEIPKEFHNGNGKWNQLVSTWFFTGLEGYEFSIKEGINMGEAIAHVKAIMGSMDPKHEHKEAGCAFLMSEFFNDYTKPEK